MTMPPAAPRDVLPDLLRPGLRVLFCGTAASEESARIGAYYAGRGNRFWHALHAAGFTPRLVRPAEFRLLARWRIGLTDLILTAVDGDPSTAPQSPGGLLRKPWLRRICGGAHSGARHEWNIHAASMSKSASGVDARLPAEAFDLPRFLASVARWQPEAIACTSLNAASVLLGLPARRLAFGEHAGQPPAAGFPRPFILPSPSGANGHWAALRHHWDEAGQEPWLRAAEGRGERGMSHRA